MKNLCLVLIESTLYKILLVSEKGRIFLHIDILILFNIHIHQMYLGLLPATKIAAIESCIGHMVLGLYPGVPLWTEKPPYDTENNSLIQLIC